MKRRRFLQRCGAGLAGAAFGATAGRAARATADKKRNIVLCVADDWGMNDAGCYGNTIVKTPGVDALAREGVVFTNAFCATPSCSPSRATILSGLYSHASGQYGLQHNYHHFSSFPDIKTMPVLLGQAGYRTVCAGKFHVAPEATYAFQTMLPREAPPVMAEACRDLIAAESDQPFFLYFCPTEPHRPFRREGADPVDPNAIIVPPHLPDTRECRQDLAEYYASIQHCDSGIARVIETLKSAGKWDETLFIFLSDNGMPWPGAKTTLYDPGIRLPCVVRNPFASRRGAQNNAMVNWADIAPTILDFAGIGREAAAMQGRTFLPILDEENPKKWDEVYASHTFHEVTMYYPMRAVRTRKYKLIWNIAHGLEFPFASDLWKSATWQAFFKSGAKMYGRRHIDAYIKRPPFELYDLETDPDEIHNLAEAPAHQVILAELKEKIRAFQDRTKDPWILKWERE